MSIVVLKSKAGLTWYEGYRVNQKHPCPVCGHDSWCTVDPKRSLCLCTRIPSGKPFGTYGRLQIIGDEVTPTLVKRLCGHKKNPDDRKLTQEQLDDIWMRSVQNMTDARYEQLSKKLGVTIESLAKLGVGYYDQNWTFPMRDSMGNLTGFRTRTKNDQKFAIKGSRQGLFIPVGMPWREELFVCEGPTDTLALMDMGFAAIGRPSCMGCEQFVVDVAAGKTTIIVSDNDNPGLKGAEALAWKLKLAKRRVKLIYPLAGKDVRDWIKAGATKGVIEAVVREANEWRRKYKGGDNA